MNRILIILFTLHLSLTCGAVKATTLSTNAQGEYKMSGPYEIIARDGQYRGSKGGSERDMKQALTFALQGKADSACTIINAYAQTLKGIDGHDAPLCTIQGYDLVRAMTILRNQKTDKWDAMVRNVWLPVLDKFEADSPYANGNWGSIVNRMRMACAIYLQDSVLYRASIDYFLHANDNGALPNYIDENGQCQETGRDQAHAQLGLEAVADECELAWSQGDDLWGALDNRVMKGFEYSARYNLGYDVPFTQWTDCTGLYCDWTKPSEFNRGKLWDIYEKPYRHYHDLKGLEMPYTKMAIEVLKGERKNTCKEGKKVHQAWTYPAPDGAPLKHDYDVYIKPYGEKEYRRIDTYMAKVNSPLSDGKHAIREISYCFFDFIGDVDIKVVTHNHKFKTARIRPDYRGVICDVNNDSTIHCLFFQPENVSVEFDGDITDNLLIFSSHPTLSMEEAKKEAKKQGRKFVYIPAGYYSPLPTSPKGEETGCLGKVCPETLLGAKGKSSKNELSPLGDLKGASDTLFIPSNTTVYVAPGAYINGTFAINDAENVSIIGRGIARPERGYEGCHVYRSRNVLIDGLILNTCPVGGSDGVTIREVKSISHPSWGDGLNVFASQNVSYDRVFCRNSDDCTTAYATRKGFSGNCRNVTMKNSTLWADVAHPIFIGIHGNAERGDTIENLRYENIDILCQAEPQLDYQGCLAINCGDNNLVRNVTFDNIRIEGILQGSICQVKVGFNQTYCKAPGRAIENVHFRNIRYYGGKPEMSLMFGYSPERMVRNVTFEGLKVNGRAIYDTMPDKLKWYKTADIMGMYVNDLVTGLTFKK